MKDPDAFFEGLKRNPFLKFLYKFPAADKAYHLVLAWLGAVRYGFPSHEVKVIGVTGTKGKTTSVELLAAILEAAGEKTALLSSVRIKTGDKEEKNQRGNSMPGRMYIQHFLRRAANSGCRYAVIEVTSQGAVLSRHRFIRFAAAAITNLAPEHIEAHGSFENYRAAKLKFLRRAALQGAPVFVNTDDAASRYFQDALPPGAVRLYSAKDLPELPANVRQILPGKFNLENIALAAALSRQFGAPEEAIHKALREFGGVPGRAEYIQREPFAVVVDYAHTPDSLRAIYNAVKEHASGKLICVFGAAGGGRDRWKRPEMGKIAAENCAEIILTDEDPYDEDPGRILADIKSGISNSQLPISKVSEILDRSEAIREALRRARPGDAVVITGKGSEQSIHLAGGKVILWNDREEAEKALKSRI